MNASRSRKRLELDDPLSRPERIAFDSVAIIAIAVVVAFGLGLAFLR